MRLIKYHEGARADFLHEVRYYSALSARLGERFDRAVRAAEVRAAEEPDLGSPYSYGTRRILDDTFRFSLVYLHSEQEVFVIAVARFRRRPGYWKGRVSGV